MELIDAAINVQVVCPSYIDSDFHESAGMNAIKKKEGSIKFMDPEEIVNMAMRDLKKGRVVSVPGLDAKIIRIMADFLPRKMFYKIIINFTRKRNEKLHR